MLKRLNLLRFRRDQSGVAAVEFALFAPILAMSLVFLVDLSNYAVQRTDMESALRSGVQYFMNGGSDLDKAKSVVLASWTSKPANATVVVERFCLCGSSEHVCTATCSDGTYPLSYSRIRAVAQYNNILIDLTNNADETVRVR
jgi:Flp pilus assembly protein TadG